jgi:ArsR family transcriptional regulator, arsenate/arsenite/antimonite-responsive transcriptional repressor / arsenate reductase (thioredoxin)
MSIDSNVDARAAVHAALGDRSRLAIVDRLVVGDVSPRELAEALGLPSNLLAHHLKVLEGAGVVRRVHSEGDHRRVYVQLVPAVLATAAPAGVQPPDRVVFVCTHNSARSQFAAAAWGTRSPVPVASAGTRPAPRVHPRAVAIASRHRLPLWRAHTSHVDAVVRPDDLVVAVCDNAHEELGARFPDRLHWSVPDPVRVGTDEAFEHALELIQERVDRLAASIQFPKETR